MSVAGMSGDQLKGVVSNASPFDLGIVAAGVLAFILSVFPYYSVSLDSSFGFGGSGTYSAWHGFFGWFGALVALAAAVLVALDLLGIQVGVPTRLAAVVGFAVATLCTFLALFVIPGEGACQGINACEDALDYGHAFGYWLSAIVVIAGLVLSVIRMTAED
jgi:hypothetical protein